MFERDNQDVLGIDIGNVITGDTDKSVLFSDRYLEVPEIKDAFVSIRELNDVFNGRVCLVSKCREAVQAKTKHWLQHRNFYHLTGVTEEKTFFCMTRAGKAPICAKEGVTDFIDDRLEVLGYLTTVKNKFLFHPNEKEVIRNKQHLPNVIRVENWKELMVAIRSV